MRKIREVLRLKFQDGSAYTHRDIGKAVSASPSTVGDYLARAEVAGLARWPLPPELDDEALEAELFPPVSGDKSPRPMPDFPDVHRELKLHRSLTLLLLWQEYKTAFPDGLQYSQFCEKYRDWAATLPMSMRQEYPAGKLIFVDYAGQKILVYDPITRELREAELFVGVLGASSYTFAEATWSQQLPDWIMSHVRMCEFFDGISDVVCPDNLKSGVTKACRYEPDINPTYQRWAAWYGTAVVPARARKPKDKAKVEKGVQVVERWILARLRNRTFTSLEALNADIRSLLTDLNSRPFRRLPGSRQSWYEEVDRPALKPLPVDRYEYEEWSQARAGLDYHVQVDHHAYSVPWQLRRMVLEVRLTTTTVEMFHNNRRVASHIRSRLQGRHTTTADHMPAHHREYREWSPMKFLDRAKAVGPATVLAVESIFAKKPHPEQAYRACLGILRLGEKFTAARLEAACERALSMSSVSYITIQRILANKMDSQRRKGQEPPPSRLPVDHDNVRGSRYFEGTPVVPEGEIN